MGEHPRMRELLEVVERLSGLQMSVLLRGESGTGKELVARAIHELGPRRSEPFIGINCGAFSRNLLEDQLFGHERGAFTGAVEAKEGVFAAAGRGTLFLDEVAELDVELQGKLLRAIQEREVVPLGSNRPVPWHARLIAATNRDLEEEVQRGRFRKDLYYRIHVVEVVVPSLRDRREDIPLLVEHFLDEFARQEGRRKSISAAALELLLAHPYPGNVRELRNAIHRAAALGPGEEIQPADLPRELRGPAGPGFKPLGQVEREHVESALRLAGGRKGLAARLLQIDRNRLARLLRKHGLAEAGRGQYHGNPGLR